MLPFNVDWRRFGNQVKGFNLTNKLKIIRRFELTHLYYNSKGTLAILDKESKRALNRLFSQMGSINFQVTELTRLNIIRLFLIKSFRGKAQAFGKPSRGQRTWSNAWTAYLYNKDLRVFINNMQRQLNKHKKEEKINYKLLKKRTSQLKTDNKLLKKINKNDLWF